MLINICKIIPSHSMPNGREVDIHTNFGEECRLVCFSVGEVAVAESGVCFHLPVVHQVEVGVVGELPLNVDVVLLHRLVVRHVLGGSVRA